MKRILLYILVFILGLISSILLFSCKNVTKSTIDQDTDIVKQKFIVTTYVGYVKNMNKRIVYCSYDFGTLQTLDSVKRIEMAKGVKIQQHTDSMLIKLCP